MDWLRNLFGIRSAERNLMRSPLQIWEVKQIARISFHYRLFKGDDKERADKILSTLEARIRNGQYSLAESP